MKKLLYLKSSPLGEGSHSTAVAEAFVAALKERHPGLEVETLDLHALELPPFGAEAVAGKWATARGAEAPAQAKAAWAAVEREIARFKAADGYVLAVPMWNFGIPYVLKHYLDVVVQPRRTFEVTPEGQYRGLLDGRKAFLALARGGAYGEGSGLEKLDHQKPYLELILGFMGIQVAGTVVVEPTAGKDAARRRESALAQARSAAARF